MRRATINVRGTLAFFLLALMAGLPAIEAGAELASAPAGFYRVDCLGNSDNIVSIPFTRPEAAFALVESVAVLNDTNAVVTVKGSPGWSVDQFAYASGSQSNTYYLRFLSSAKEGSYYPILSNDANNLTLSLGGDDLSSVTNGTPLAVIPYWTLGTAFPQGNGVVPSPSAFIRRTEVIIPDVNGVGINLSPLVTYYFVTNATFPNGIWQQVGAGTTSKNDDVLLPDNYFIVRHNTDSNTVFTALGSVPVSKLTVPLSTETTTKQDNFVALTRPATNTLDESGLVQSGAFIASPSVFNRSDELLVFDNNQIAKNKAAKDTYYYLGTWRRVGSGTIDMGSQPVFTPGTGVIIRKQTNGVSSLWINSPTY
jgi:uncharacterized protein (TIGR02597 family)